MGFFDAVDIQVIVDGETGDFFENTAQVKFVDIEPPSEILQRDPLSTMFYNIVRHFGFECLAGDETTGPSGCKRSTAMKNSASFVMAARR